MSVIGDHWFTPTFKEKFCAEVASRLLMLAGDVSDTSVVIGVSVSTFVIYAPSYVDEFPTPSRITRRNL